MADARTRESATEFPAIAEFRERFGAYLWVSPPNPLSVWVASLSGYRDGYVVRLKVTGASEQDCLQRLERVLAEWRSGS